MATLIGIDWPINSVGVLPDVDPTRPGFLENADGGESGAKFALVNAKVRDCSSPSTSVILSARSRSCLNILDENIVGKIFFEH